MLAASLAVVAACATPAEQAEKLVRTYGPFCEKLGFRPETDAYAQCIQQQGNADRARRQAASTANQQQLNRQKSCVLVGSVLSCN